MGGLLAGVVSGVGICLFGMWAFLKGQATMLDTKQGMRPQLFQRPPHADGRTDDLSRQVRALFSQPEKKGE